LSAARSHWIVTHEVNDLASASAAAVQRAFRPEVTLINIFASLMAILTYIHAPRGLVKKRGWADLTAKANVYTLGPQ
jgi:hypothetical protein